MLKVIIPDPGLREYGGHHPAMIDALASSLAVINGEIQLDVYCSKDCSNEFIEKTKSKHISITPHFSIDFYQYFYKDPSLNTLNHYINLLTKEYLQVLQFYRSNKQHNRQSEQLLFLYHTLNWEHALALGAAIAIDNKKNTVALKHSVFLMFNPIKLVSAKQTSNSQNTAINNRRYLNFKIGFSLLQKQKNTTLFAGEAELQQHYQQLLQPLLNGKTIDIHPCGLCDVNKSENDESAFDEDELSEVKYLIPKQSHCLERPSKKTTSVTSSIILFTGDAKVNKGFLELPEITEKLIQKIQNDNVNFIIQYTITNNGEAINKAGNQLIALAKKDSRVKLTMRFWSHEELHENFAAAKVILFNYDSSVYQNQSSGVLWLAALHKLSMVFLTSNWLTREAKRLACEHTVSNNSNLSANIYKYLMQKTKEFDKVSTENSYAAAPTKYVEGNLNARQYRQALFKNLGEWLKPIDNPD